MTIFQLAKRFASHLAGRRRKQLSILLILMIFASFAEVLSLGAILPFLGVLTQPDRVYNAPVLQPFIRFLQIDSAQALLLPLTVLFILAALLAGGARLLLLYVQTRLSYAIGADFSYQIYRRTLYQPYSVHVSRNSSEIISGVTTKVNMIISYFLTPILTLLSSTVILIAILAVLMIVDPLMSVVAVSGFGLIYGIVIFVTRRRLSISSKRISTKSNQVVKILQEGLGGIRDILIDGTQELYCEQYREADVLFRRSQASSIIIGGSPRFAAEALGMVLIALLAYVLASQEGEVASTITLLGALALGAQRLLPVLQQGYLSVVQLRSGRHSLQDALSLLDQPIATNALETGEKINLPFRKGIELRNLGFSYTNGSTRVLHGLSLYIPAGSKVGFIGATGSGKSTLLDIIMGLLTPSEGEIWIDDIELNSTTRPAWREYIGHVPQSIYLSDASITRNIAFGLPQTAVDMDRVRQSARKAQIDAYIESLPYGYDTLVGERGVRLSGGQRQRIGIARALYKQAKVIILDEATSALDNETENAVMSAINDLDTDVTVLAIAHRLTTLQRSDLVVELRDGHIYRTGSYESVVSGR